MKTLKFKQHPDGSYTIRGYRGAPIGDIAPRGELFKKRMVMVSFGEDVEWTSECLDEVAKFMASKETKKTRATSRKST